MKKTTNSKGVKSKKESNPKPKIQITTIATVIMAIAAIVAIYVSFYQSKSMLKEKAPVLSLEQVSIKSQSPDKSTIIVTVRNNGQRVALFKYAYNYVLNTLKGTAIANSVFTTEEILPNKIATWDFSQPNNLTISPNTYYCTKIWYEDEEIKDTKPKELFYKLEVLDGTVISSSIPNDVLKLFKAQIAEYEKSSLFKSSDI